MNEAAEHSLTITSHVDSQQGQVERELVSMPKFNVSLPRGAGKSSGFCTIWSTTSMNGFFTFSRVLELTSQNPASWDSANALPSSNDTTRLPDAALSNLLPTLI